jgi:hypothetical protein
MSHVSTLVDATNENIGIDFDMREWASDSNLKKDQFGLDNAVSSAISVRVAEGKITKENFTVSVEEILDLLFHIDKFTQSREEDRFEWSTVDPTVQMLAVRREGPAIHAELLMKMYGYPEGYTGNATLNFQFDIEESGLKAFQKGLKEQLLSLLANDESILDRLTQELNNKIKTMRERNRSLYAGKREQGTPKNAL